MKNDLTVVMPVYNEADCIRPVVEAWLECLQAMSIGFQILVINDGSLDGTAQAIETYREHPNVMVLHKPNSGHGPTILRGYRKAVEDSDWVFQCDSDDEISPEDFMAFWSQRNDADAIIGVRQNRAQPLARKSSAQRAAGQCACSTGAASPTSTALTA